MKLMCVFMGLFLMLGTELVGQEIIVNDSFFVVGHLSKKGRIQRQTLKAQIPVILDTSSIKHHVYYSHSNAEFLYFYPNEKTDSSNLDSVSLKSIKLVRENRTDVKVAGAATIVLGGFSLAGALYLNDELNKNTAILESVVLSLGILVTSVAFVVLPIVGTSLLLQPTFKNSRYDIVSFKVPMEFQGSKSKIKKYIDKYNIAYKKKLAGKK